MRLIQVARSLLLALSLPVLLILGGKGPIGVSAHDVSWSSASSLSSSAVCSGWYAFQIFLINVKALHLTGLCFIWFGVTIFNFRPILPCSVTSGSLIIKVATIHHSIIQKEVDELLAKGTIEPSSGGAGFYSSMFVVHKFTGGHWPILNLKCFNRYMHIPSFNMPTIRHVWQLIQHGDYLV